MSAVPATAAAPAAGGGNAAETAQFLLNVTGQIACAEFPSFDYIRCNYCFQAGKDWCVTSGIEDGMTQTSVKTPDERQLHHLNFPIEITYKSSSPFGWPQLVVHAYGVDLFGNDVVRGYGACHIPMQPGSHTRRIAMFVPESSSLLMKLNAWFMGKRPEFCEPRSIAMGEGRDVTRVRTQGFVTLHFNIQTKNMRKLGYECQPNDISGFSGE